ncbi:MAG: squalene--hopene cyclase [Deltaproteobacteria bacterium]|nr:squalene--hopene cyclase [Deltaproteobacteria bacterium]
MTSPSHAPSLYSVSPLDQALTAGSRLLSSYQLQKGYWWYRLEANESINAELIFLYRYLGISDPELETGIARRLMDSQNPDGSWSLYFGGPGDLSTTIECYLALKVIGVGAIHELPLQLARAFILAQGGLTKCRVFTRIHLALFGLLDWKYCPAMPVTMIHLPSWFPLNIYNFSSWARATIVPLLVIQDKKNVRPLPPDFLDELYGEGQWARLDLPLLHHLPLPFKNFSLKKCEKWIREHLARTEDIYPAMAYGAMALHALGASAGDAMIQKVLGALKKFRSPVGAGFKPAPTSIYQQCCISPVWDTPWAGVALLEAGLPSDDPNLLKAGRWLLFKQIKNDYGYWAVKNKRGKPGGWSFEFENDYFPDVDDTIEVLLFLKRLKLPESEIRESFRLGLDWLFSMQSKNGGWAAFDKDNTRDLVNKIPFADHGACLDPPTPDITGRMVELLALSFPAVVSGESTIKAIRFLEKTQEPAGCWEGRWGVNYVYGTWCVLQGLKAIGYDMTRPNIRKAAEWLKLVQNEDGGFGESCDSYRQKKFVPLDQSIPSQTAWGLMGLLAAGEIEAAHRAASFLIQSQNPDGGWDENHHTGTGFPGHFYIRYHGYRQYFPLLALAKYRALTK